MPITALHREEAEDWIRLAFVPELPVPLALKAVQVFGGAAEALSAPLKDLAREVGGRTAEAMRAVGRGSCDAELELVMDWLESKPMSALLPIYDPLYPQGLIEAGSAPLVLYLAGDFDVLEKPRIALAGTEAPDEEGRRNAADFAAAISRAGMTAVSALESSSGIAGAALEGVLSVRGAPIALLATAPDRALGKSAPLQRRVLDEGGLLVSAVRPGYGVSEESRQVRDVLLAAFAPTLLVVEADRSDPALLVARQAADAGVQVGAVPGSIHNPQYKGCHRLIRDGAALVETLSDLGVRRQLR